MLSFPKKKPIHLPFYPRTKQCSVSRVKVFLKRKRKGSEKLLEHEESGEELGIGNEDMLEVLAIFTIVIYTSAFKAPGLATDCPINTYI